MAVTVPAYKPTMKQLLWFRCYTDENNKTTFANGVQSSLVAYDTTDYNTANQLALDNKRLMAAMLTEWLDEVGLSDTTLKLKVKELMSAKETKFFANLGRVGDSREVEALEIQRRATDMAIKIKGMYAADKLDVSGLEGLAGRLTRAGQRTGDSEAVEDDEPLEDNDLFS